MHSESERNRFLDKVADCIGPKAFNKCIDSIPETERLGRLRYWQESLFVNADIELENSEAHFLSTFGELEAFLYLFKSANRRRYQISWEEFLSSPSVHFDDPMCDIPTGWLSAAMKNEDFREYLYGVVACSFMFQESFEAAPDVVAVIRRYLPLENWQECYDFINNELSIPESEWRTQFARTFPEYQ